MIQVKYTPNFPYKILQNLKTNFSFSLSLSLDLSFTY